MNNLRIFEAFAGIGAQRKALTNIGAPYSVIGLAEWFVPAILAYHSIHDDVPILNATESIMRRYLETKTLSMDSKSPVKPGYWNRVKGYKLRTIYSYVIYSENAGNIFDISTLTERNVKGIDLLTYSFPCQDISVQGKGEGIKEGTRSGLLYEIERYIRSLPDDELPKYLLLENVKALVNKTHIKDFEKWLAYLETRGYKTDWKVLNSKEFGAAQSRERVFALSTLDELVELPTKNYENENKVLNDILDSRFNDNLYRLEKLELYPKTPFSIRRGWHNIRKCCLIGYSTFQSETYVYDKLHIGPTLTAQGANSRIKILEGEKIRLMNPRECYRYLGFSQEDFENVENLNILTDAKLVLTAGNSISVEVLESIFKKITRP